MAGFLEYGGFEIQRKMLTEFLRIEPDEKGSIGIDSAGRLARFLCVKPVSASRRTVFISGGEALTSQAQHSILKILEEPPQWGLIIISASSMESLMPTLCSRLQKVYIGASFKGVYNNFSRENGFKELIEMKVIDEPAIDRFFENILQDLDRDPIGNVRYLKQVLARLAAIKRLNTNVRLQLRALRESFKNQRA